MTDAASLETPGRRALIALWQAAGLPVEVLARATLSGADPVLPSSFAIGTAAQASITAAALAATEIGRQRNGLVRSVHVDCREAALECSGHFTLDGTAPTLWDPIAGLYRCGRAGDAGWLRLHTNFAHHRDGVLRLLGLPSGPGTPRAAVAAALDSRDALEFETAATTAGLCVAALRSFDTWDALPQATTLAGQPLIAIERIGDAAPLAWPTLPTSPTAASPLDGIRVVELTRILAGPVGGRTLATYGADVMLVNSPHLPNIAAIADTSRGKRSALADLREPAGRDGLGRLLSSAHVLIDGYRPGALAALGFGAEAVAAQRPGIVVVSLSAYGETGPWGGKRGFDSLVQTATGFNLAEAEAAASDSNSTAASGAIEPKAMPVQILDMATGFLIAFGAQAALLRQQAEGGSWRVRVSLARTGLWLRQFGRIANGFNAPAADFAGLLETGASGFGELVSVRHAARFSDPIPPPPSHPSPDPMAHPMPHLPPQPMPDPAMNPRASRLRLSRPPGSDRLSW